VGEIGTDRAAVAAMRAAGDDLQLHQAIRGDARRARPASPASRFLYELAGRTTKMSSLAVLDYIFSSGQRV